MAGAPRFVVTRHAAERTGLSPEDLAAALAAPLGELGVEVICRPQQAGGGGLEGDAGSGLASLVQHIVERTVCG